VLGLFVGDRLLRSRNTCHSHLGLLAFCALAVVPNLLYGQRAGGNFTTQHSGSPQRPFLFRAVGADAVFWMRWPSRRA